MSPVGFSVGQSAKFLRPFLETKLRAFPESARIYKKDDCITLNAKNKRIRVIAYVIIADCLISLASTMSKLDYFSWTINAPECCSSNAAVNLLIRTLVSTIADWLCSFL